MENIHTDTVIIGASIAGSFCAYLLALNGYSYCLIEPSEIPKEKACGEGLSMIGKKYLEHSGLWHQRLEPKALPYYSYDIEFKDNKKIALSKNAAIGYSIQRPAIDGCIFNAAQSDFLKNNSKAKVTSIQKDGEFWKIITADKVYTAKNVIIASGKNGRNLTGSNPPPDKGPENRFGLAFKCRGKWKGSYPNKVFIKNHGTYQILLTPLAHGVINLSILKRKQSSGESQITKDHLVNRALEYAGSLGFIIDSYEDCKGASSISSSTAGLDEPGIFFIGDAAQIFDPVGGMGMSHALFSASLAAEYVMKIVNKPHKSATYTEKYYKKRKLYSLIFSLLTYFSYQLNCKENYFLKKFVFTFPKAAVFINALLCRAFPLVGAVRHVAFFENFKIGQLKEETL